MVDALVEQDGVDLGGCLVGKTRRAQKVEYGSTFVRSQARFIQGGANPLQVILLRPVADRNCVTVR